MNNKVSVSESGSFSVEIYIAGSESDAERVCREYCADVGFCVTVTPTKYVYSWGAEEGVIVGLINYPRFPDSEDSINRHAIDLGSLLMDRLFQRSFTIKAPGVTTFYSREIDR